MIESDICVGNIYVKLINIRYPMLSAKPFTGRERRQKCANSILKCSLTCQLCYNDLLPIWTAFKNIQKKELQVQIFIEMEM